MLDIKLQPVSEVMKIREDTGIIKLEQPINLHLGTGNPESVAPRQEISVENAFDAKPVKKVETSVKIKTEDLPPPPPKEVATSHTKSESIVVDLGSGSSQVSIELSSPQMIENPATDTGMKFDLSMDAPPIELGTSASGTKFGGTTVAPVITPIEMPPLPVEMSSHQVEAIAMEPVQVSASASVVEAPVTEDVPYLFSEGGKTSTSLRVTRQNPQVVQSATLGMELNDVLNKLLALQTAGTSGNQSHELDSLKDYLTMREQDIAVLKVQLAYAREELEKSGDQNRRFQIDNDSLRDEIKALENKNAQLMEEKLHAGRSQDMELDRLRFDLKSKIDRIGFLEQKLKDAEDQHERLKERVRLDIRKIRVREKELESKLEILKKDSETLIASRESKILELKRRIDLLEFNYDMLVEKNDAEKKNLQKSREKDDQVRKALKLALGMIENEAHLVSEHLHVETSGVENVSEIEFSEPEVKVA